MEATLPFGFRDHPGYTMNSIRSLAACGAVALVAAASGCRLGPAWNVDTTYVVQDVSAEGKDTLMRTLNDPRSRHKFGFELVSKGAEGDPLVFKLTAVRDMKGLTAVHKAIEAASQDSRYPVVLQEATMTFASVYGQAASSISITGTATPGATVILDVGARTVEVPVATNGSWTANITRNGKLSDRGGWVYGAIRKGAAMHYIKMNILDTTGSTRILPQDLPSDSLLR